MTQSLVSLESLIEEGRDIWKALQDPNDYLIFGYSDKYEIWKNTVIRFISSSFPEDRCVVDFENACAKFDSYYQKDSVKFSKVLGVLEAYNILPFPVKAKMNSKSGINIQVSNTQSQIQNQTQEQAQSIAIEIFIEAIKDELTGKQVKEIKGIFTEEPDPKKARTKIFDKIKSFGSDVASNVLANILTNPAIWGNL